MSNIILFATNSACSDLSIYLSIYIYIYIYIYKLKRNIYCYYAPVKSHHHSFSIATLSTNFQHFFNSFLFLINLSTYCYTFSNFSHFFYIFISPLLSTLISFSFIPLSFFTFGFSYSPPLTINLQFSFSFYT